jgi:hypothetical protein
LHKLGFDIGKYLKVVERDDEMEEERGSGDLEGECCRVKSTCQSIFPIPMMLMDKVGKYWMAG